MVASMTKMYPLQQISPKSHIFSHNQLPASMTNMYPLQQINPESHIFSHNQLPLPPEFAKYNVYAMKHLFARFG